MGFTKNIIGPRKIDMTSFFCCGQSDLD